jgi:hypothetical protein
VDFVVYLLVELLLPPALRAIYKSTQLILSVGLLFIGVAMGKAAQDRASVAWAGMVSSYI